MQKQEKIVGVGERGAGEGQLRPGGGLRAPEALGAPASGWAAVRTPLGVDSTERNCMLRMLVPITHVSVPEHFLKLCY